jgi:hypothetical protein
MRPFEHEEDDRFCPPQSKTPGQIHVFPKRVRRGQPVTCYNCGMPKPAPRKPAATKPTVTQPAPADLDEQPGCLGGVLDEIDAFRDFMARNPPIGFVIVAVAVAAVASIMVALNSVGGDVGAIPGALGFLAGIALVIAIFVNWVGGK